MRQNLPVTQREYPLAPDVTLVSTTDLQGRITYCNSAFIEVSGYSRDELMGQPHNLIRHPDMPAEGFRDLWATVEAGRPWTGVVKNRRRDGDHYWVQANVTPILEAGRPVGYLSVRTVPTREQVQACEALYATMRAEAEAGRLLHQLKAGRVQRQDWRGRLLGLTRLGLGARVSAAAGLVGALGLGLGFALGQYRADAPLLAWSGLAAGLVVATVGGGWWLNRLTTRPMLTLLLAANRMAAGDMSQTLDSDRDDLLGQFTRALNQLGVNLRSIVADARAEVDRMRSAAREIAAGNHDLSARTETQAANLQRTASSMTAIQDHVRLNVESARQAASCAQEATAVTGDGTQAVQQVATTMQGIRDSSGRIGESIGVIEGIAFQTNILALNAAVEAARAGEAGRGFAVGAGEVRALAPRTSSAAREIKTLIETSVVSVATGSRLVHEAGQAMGGLVSSVQRVTDIIGEISAATSEQDRSLQHVNQAVNTLDQATQQNAALVEESAAAAHSLSEQADRLRDVMEAFERPAAVHHGDDDGDLRPVPQARWIAA